MKYKIFSLASIVVFFIACERNKDNNPYGTLIEVPNEINSIKEAVNVSMPFDTILIYPGEYFEYDIEIKKPIYITSMFLFDGDSSQIKQTIINGNSKSRVFTISDIADTIKMNGLTIKKGLASDKSPLITEFTSWNGGGIYCFNANLKLLNILLIENSAYQPNSRGDGGGMYIEKSSVYLENVHIDNNSALDSGGAFICDSSTLKIRDSFIRDNYSSNVKGGPPIGIMYSILDFRNVIFSNNENGMGGIWDFYIYNSTGVFENVQITNDTTIIRDCSIEFKNCEIPGY